MPLMTTSYHRNNSHVALLLKKDPPTNLLTWSRPRSVTRALSGYSLVLRECRVQRWRLTSRWQHLRHVAVQGK